MAEIRRVWGRYSQKVSQTRTHVDIDGPEENPVTQIEIHVTHEGVIVNLTDDDGDIIGTESETFDEIIGRIMQNW